MNSFYRANRLIRRYAAIPVLIVSSVALTVFLSLGFRSILGPIIGAVIGAAVAVYFLHLRSIGQTNITDRAPPNPRIPVIVSSLYVFSIFAMYRLTLHTRPLVHYFVFGGFAGYIGYEIATGARSHRVIPQLVVLTFLTYWSAQLAYPAGMFNPDTPGKYFPAIRTGITNGFIEGSGTYLGHLVYALEVTIVTGLSVDISYYLLSTILLTGTIAVFSLIDRVFPSISYRVALYGALFFGCMSWTLSRGLHPGKLSFFYGLTLLLGLVIVVQFAGISAQQMRRWAIIGFFASPAITFGHRFSGGAAMVFLLSITVFVACHTWLSQGEGIHFRIDSGVAFVSGFTLLMVGLPIHQRPIIERFVGLIMSIYQPYSGGSGGPGRFSELSQEVLLISTSSQTILFALGVLGAAIAIRRADWEYDLVFFWMAILSLLLGASLIFNARDFQPQRFYALMGLFGLNLFAGVALVRLVKTPDINWGAPAFISVIIFLFAVTSFGSPVAGMHNSFIGDQVPHNPWFTTSQLSAGNEWVDKYSGNETTILTTNPASSELPVRGQGGVRAVVNTTAIETGYRYVYTPLAVEAGIRTSGGLGLGDRRFVFLEFNPPPRDDLIYTNGETTVRVNQG